MFEAVTANAPEAEAPEVQLYGWLNGAVVSVAPSVPNTFGNCIDVAAVAVAPTVNEPAAAFGL